MGDSIGFRFDTAEFEKMIEDRLAQMPVAARRTVAELGKVAQTAGQAKAPVLAGRPPGGDKRKRHDAKQPGAGPIPGLLRASIRSGVPYPDGTGSFSVKVGPRGDRVHLYAGKEEQRRPYMAAALVAARNAATRIADTIFGKTWEG